MRWTLNIVVAATVAAMCVFPAAGQSYRRNKVKTEPEPLTFSRTITVDKRLNPDLWELTRNWDSESCGVDKGTYWDVFEYNYMSYVGRFEDMVADNIVFDLLIWMKLIYKGPYELNLFAYEVTTFSSKDPVMDLSAEDNRLNRPWLWRVFHNIETVDKQRQIAEKCFNLVADSLEDFLRNGPKSEFQLLN